jgi:hypothetical protein
MSGSSDARAPRAVALVVAVLTVMAIAAPVSAVPTPPRTYGPAIESLASYVPQRLCSPTAKPGRTPSRACC